MSQHAWKGGDRAYKRHAGDVYFMCGGRLLTSTDGPIVLVLVLAFIAAAPVVWLAFEAPYVWRAISPAPIVIFAYTTLNMWACVCRTSFCDPGVIPRGLNAGGEPTDRSIALERVDDGGLSGSLTTTIASPWCKTCEIYRPPRASHCRACNNCVDTIDHHCVFLNACIGRRNYAPFVAMLFHMLFCLVIAIVCSALHIYYIADPHTPAQRASKTGFVGALREVPQSAVFFGCALLLLIPVACLLTFHLWLITRNRTTIEQVRFESTGRIYDMERHDAGCCESSQLAQTCSRCSAWVRSFFISAHVAGTADTAGTRRRRTPFQRTSAWQNSQAALGRAVPREYISWRDTPP